MSTKAPAVTLEYVKTIGIVNNGDNGRGFANPYDVAVTRDGRICVLNRCDPPRTASIRVGICNLDEEYLSEFRLGYGDGDGQVTLPVCLAFDSRERLHVTDENNHRVSVFDLSGKFLDRWGSPGSGDGELDGAAGIAIDSNDDVYVADQHNHRIQKFDRDGVYLSQWGSRGSGAGQLDMPWGLAVDREDNVYVADWRNDRVQKFSSKGRFLASFGEPGRGDGQLHRPSGVAVDADGNVYVSDWGNERLQVLGPDGALLWNERGRATLSKWAKEFFASNPDEMSTRERSDLVSELPEHLREPYHESSQTEPYFWGPTAVSLDSEGRVYIPETNRHRFQVYRLRSA